MTKEQQVNQLIREGVDTNLISDGYHTFGELYEHRITIFIALCKVINKQDVNAYGKHKQDLSFVWRSKAHSDGSVWDGWFILGIFRDKGDQITYHLPMDKWEETKDFSTLEKAPEWDGHTSEDVLSRLKRL